jgi:hypothetical protein
MYVLESVLLALFSYIALYYFFFLLKNVKMVENLSFGFNQNV